MPAYPFTVIICGLTKYGMAFDTAAELDSFMAGRQSLPTSAPAPAAQIEPSDEPRARGRPSFDAILSAAVSALDLRDCKNLSDRARRVLKHLAQQTRDAEDIPSMSKVRAFLAADPVARNSARKYARKSKRVRIARTAGGN